MNFSSLIRFISIAVTALMLVSACPIFSFAAEGKNTIYFEVEDITRTADGASVTLRIINNAGYRASFGWVSDPTFILDTVSGKKLSATNVIYPNPMKKIAPHSTSKIYLTFDDIEENIRSIAITDVVTLDDRGLPDVDNYATVVVDIEYK